MQVGTTKDRGLYNKPSAAVHPGTLAAGTLTQYNNTYTRVTKTRPAHVTGAGRPRPL